MLFDIAPQPFFDLSDEQRMLFVAVAGVALVLCVGAMLFIFLRLFRRRPAAEETPRSELAIDVAALPAVPPPKDGPQLEFYGTPVRLSLIVLAPVGRGGQIPPSEVMTEILENLIPNFSDVVAAHQPRLVLWPNQLSSQGFLQAFFNLVALPGDHGKGTPWCSAAGKFEAYGEQYLAGLVCCAAAPNSLGEMTVERPGQWLSILRVKSTP